MTELRMPQAGMEMTEGVLAKWLIPDGGHVKEGDALYTLETDKVEMEVEAPTTGVLRHGASEGQTYPVGALLGHIE